MAGGGHGGHSPVKIDAGVEAWSAMRENVYKTFRFTPKTTRSSLVWALAVPVLLYYGIADQNNKWDWIGKRRTDSLRRQNPGVQE